MGRKEKGGKIMLGLLSRLLRKKTVPEKQKPLPYEHIPRYKCPFYGFSHPFFKGIMDQYGNQCSLITGSYSPCQMEFAKQTPEWEKCPFINKGNGEELETIKKTFHVFPREFRPPSSREWAGISFQDWFDYVMDEKTPRPF